MPTTVPQHTTVPPQFQDRRVFLKGRPSIPYDVLSINVGIAPLAISVPGADQHTTSVKPIDKCEGG